MTINRIIFTGLLTWHEHFKKWRDIFDGSDNIIGTINDAYLLVPSSMQNDYFQNLELPSDIKYSNPMAYALATTTQRNYIVKFITENSEMYFTYLDMINSVFADSAFGRTLGNEMYKIEFSLFDTFKNYLDWFGIFYRLKNVYPENIAYTKELYQKYYAVIFKSDSEYIRPDLVAGFWKAVKQGVVFPVEYIQTSLVNQNTTFSIDENGLFYPAIIKYWDTGVLEDYLLIDNNVNNIDNIKKFMELLRLNHTISLLIRIKNKS